MSKIPIQIISISLAEIFRKPVGAVVTVEDHLAEVYFRTGAAKKISSFEFTEDIIEEKPVQKSEVKKDNRRETVHIKDFVPQQEISFFGKKAPVKFNGLKVAWIQDAEKIGGAELSNSTLINVGKKLGHQITLVTPQNFKLGAILEADVSILNGFFAFSDEQIRQLYFAFYEKDCPYVRYEHDHREIQEETMRQLARKPFLGYARRLFTRSLMNVFISPLHYEEHLKALGLDIESHPHMILRPAVDPNHFKPVEGIKRDAKLIVNLSGQLIQRKGLMNMYQFVQANKKFKFHIYTKRWATIDSMFKEIENVEIKDLVDYSELPKIYSGAGSVIHLPIHFEDCGRTPIEGALCGCAVISNMVTGAMTFDFWKKFGKFNEQKGFVFADIEKRGALADYLVVGQYEFWKNINHMLEGLK